MKEISEHIELKFYQVLKHKIKIEDFEQWVYGTKKLEDELPEEVYIDLISLNYKAKYAHAELEKVIGPFVQNGKFEIKRITRFLKSIIARDEDCAEAIEMTYDLYCSGYNFLRRLGLTYGLYVACPPSGNYEKTWNETSKEDQDELLDTFYPDIIADAQNALNWFENEKIVINDSVDDRGNFQYDDFRSLEEIEQGDIEVIDLDQERKQASANASNRGKSQKFNVAIPANSSFWSKLRNWF